MWGGGGHKTPGYESLRKFFRSLIINVFIALEISLRENWEIARSEVVGLAPTL